MKYAYYPGCAAKDSCRELDLSTKKVFEKLGIDVVDLSDVASCCGTREIRVANPTINNALNARTLAMAEEQGLDILTVCSTCQLTMTQVNNALTNDPDLLRKTNEVLSEIGLKYDGKTRIKHLLRFLAEDFGLEKIKERVTLNLNATRIAPFYGCHFIRPKCEHGFGDKNEPTWLEDIIQLCGGKPVLSTEGRDVCCGYPLLMTNEKLAIRMAGQYLLRAKQADVNCVVTPCPLCHIAFDMFQSRIEKELRIRLGIPILHFSQFMGLVLGFSPREIGIKRHMVAVDKFLNKIL
jgi:succinate dehydrogenase / fumarate reductase cytochrome b subunit